MTTETKAGGHLGGSVIIPNDGTGRITHHSANLYEAMGARAEAAEAILRRLVDAREGLDDIYDVAKAASEYFNGPEKDE